MKFFKLYVAFEAVCCCWFQNLVCAQQETTASPNFVAVQVKADPSFSWAPRPGTVQLGKISKVNGTEAVLLTIGTGTAAGYRDGGLFRQGQLTSYPNLVARQMGLVDFKQPLFSVDKGNGTGYLVADGKGHWSKVVNNLAYLSPDSMRLSPSDESTIHNFSAPGNHPNKYLLNPTSQLEYAIKFYEENPSMKMRENSDLLWTAGEMPTALLSRFIPKQAGSTWDYLTQINPNAAILDLNTDIYTQIHLNGGQAGILAARERYWELDVINYLNQKGAKYIYATSPDILDFPYFHLFNPKNLPQIYSIDINMLRNGSPNPEVLPTASILLPTQNTRKLFDGKFTEYDYLFETDVITPDEMSRPDAYNKMVIQWSKEFNYPVVDFYTIYKTILKGDYVTDDGLKIDPSYPNGNFFSSDGMYPSAIGQAVLANEVIRVFNKSFEASIPLIHVGDFAKELTKIQ